MPTTRTPIGRGPSKPKITPAAIAAFKRMQKLEAACTCKPIDWEGKYWEREECKACEQWWEEHSILFHELKLPPWEWPAIERPDACSPYPKGSRADQSWKSDLAAQVRYRALEQAVEEV
jgi:hypothetical protein